MEETDKGSEKIEIVPAIVKHENGGKKLKREFVDDSESSKQSKRRHKGHEEVEESEGEHSVYEEEMKEMKSHEEEEAVGKRIKKSRVVVSKQYGNVHNKELTDMFYELSRAFFKSGDTNRYGIMS